MKTINERVDQLITRLYHRRCDPNKSVDKWTLLCREDIRPLKMREKIEQLLRAGYIVTTGYYCTSIRGFHEHTIFYRSRKS
jgi:hypothetical protein